MTKVICPCCPAVPGPAGLPEEPTVGLSEEEMTWTDGKHLDLGHPSVLKYLDKDLQNDSTYVQKLATNYGCCSAFKILSDEGVRAMDLAVDSIEKYAVCSPRIPKVLRGGTFRSKFLNGMAHSQAVLRKVSELAGCEMIYHPMKIQQLHINFKPSDEGNQDDGTRKKNVDRWHCDTTPFVLIVFATNPDEYTGGALQYFNGPREEGIELLGSGKGLPADRVLDVGRQEKGYGVFMQGWRVFHQVTPVLTGDARTTLVYSFQPRNVLALEACLHLSQTYNKVDPLHIFLSDWARYRAWKTVRRFEICTEHWGTLLQQPHANALSTAITESTAKMTSIVHKLPYTDDRELMRLALEEGISALRVLLLTMSDTDCTLDKEFVESPYGLPNLRAALVDIANCAEDIVTLKDTTMMYF